METWGGEAWGEVWEKSDVNPFHGGLCFGPHDPEEVSVKNGGGEVGGKFGAKFGVKFGAEFLVKFLADVWGEVFLCLKHD